MTSTTFLCLVIGVLRLYIFYFSIKKRNTKEKLYTCYLRPVAMYAYETWCKTLGDEEKLLTFERKVLRKILRQFDTYETKIESMNERKTRT